jgi:hypothetical protein
VRQVQQELKVRQDLKGLKEHKEHKVLAQELKEI